MATEVQTNQIKQELTTYLRSLSDEELKSATKKQCVAYLKQKMDKALIKQNKSIIKSFLMEYIVNYLKAKKMKETDESGKNTLNEQKKEESDKENKNQAKNRFSSNPRKRKLGECNDSNNEQQPALKKRKLSTDQIIDTLNYLEIKSIDIEPVIESKDEQQTAKNMGNPHNDDEKEKGVENMNIKSPKNDDYKDNEMDDAKDRESEACTEKCGSIEDIEEMASLIQADNVLSKLNEKLMDKQQKNKNQTKVNCDYGSLEHEALKNKLSKCQGDLLKSKQTAQKFAALLQPKVKKCQQLKDEIEILNKNIDILKNKHLAEIDKMKNQLKNETENVKEERFNSLRKDKYIHRMEKKFDFICNKYNINKDSVVVEMSS